MTGVILFAFFAVVAIGAVAVLADSFLRGRDAFARLRCELRQSALSGGIVVTIVDFAAHEVPAAPRLRVSRRAKFNCRAPTPRQRLAVAA
ncbi:hypothetical protein [Pelagerythrobacter sp.]|uniref:hypothetical protein n=1 Tax=Pelagerythrobacter sp. TaxID=2800702 RepID=UPI0035B4350D